MPALVLAGCSSKGSKATVEPAASPSPTSVATATPVPCVDAQGHGPDGATKSCAAPDGSDDPGETNGAVRIPLGQARTVPVPADAVLDIKGLPEWDRSALRCTATTGSGKQLELFPPDPGVQPEQAAHGGTWVPFWTVGAPPGEVTIQCADPGSRIPNGDTSFIRVVPRGLPPMR